MKVALGVDIGGTTIRIVVVSEDGRVLTGHTHATPLVLEGDTEGIAGRLIEIVREAFKGEALKGLSSAESGTIEVIGIGFGIAGLIDRKNGVVIDSPNISAIKGLPVKQIFEKECSLPVIVENDASACAYGEKWVGTGRTFENFVAITLGTGLGGGIIYKGELFEGPAEIGHMVIEPHGRFCTCGSYGCLESYASGRAIVDRTTSSLEKGTESMLTQCCEGNFYKITPDIVYKTALEGDNLSREVFRETGQFLGIGIANVINLFGPEAVIIGGGLVGAWDLFIEALEKEVSKRAFKPFSTNVKILKTELKEDSGAIGAAGLVIKAVRESSV